MSYIARQPNGLLCRFSTVVNTVTDINMTEEDYVELCAERAREEARWNLSQKNFIKSYDRVLADRTDDNITDERWRELRKQMGEHVEED